MVASNFGGGPRTTAVGTAAAANPCPFDKQLPKLRKMMRDESDNIETMMLRLIGVLKTIVDNYVFRFTQGDLCGMKTPVKDVDFTPAQGSKFVIEPIHGKNYVNFYGNTLLKDYYFETDETLKGKHTCSSIALNTGDDKDKQTITITYENEKQLTATSTPYLRPGVMCEQVVDDVLTKVLLPMLVPMLALCTGMLMVFVYMFWISRQEPRFLKAIGMILCLTVMLPAACGIYGTGGDMDCVAGFGLFGCALTQCMVCYMDALHFLDPPIAEGTVLNQKDGPEGNKISTLTTKSAFDTLPVQTTEHSRSVKQRLQDTLKNSGKQYYIENSVLKVYHKQKKQDEPKQNAFTIKPRFKAPCCPCYTPGPSVPLSSGSVLNLHEAHRVVRACQCLTVHGSIYAAASACLCSAGVMDGAMKGELVQNWQLGATVTLITVSLVLTGAESMWYVLTCASMDTLCLCMEVPDRCFWWQCAVPYTDASTDASTASTDTPPSTDAWSQKLT